MKYSFMTFSCPGLSLTECLALAKKHGYQGIEPRIDAGHKHGIERDAPAHRRKEFKKQARDSGIALCCIATSNKYANPAETQAMVEQSKANIDLAGDVGAPRLRVFGGGFPDTVSREQAIDIVSRALASLADHAKSRNVVLCLETHDFWCDPRYVVEVVRRVNHPAVGVNWDIMHPVRTAKVAMADAFKTLQPWIRHVHFHDGVNEGDKLVLKPIGTGMIDHRTAVQLLTKVKYADFLSGEWINWDDGYDVHLPRELATMKQYESEAK